MKVVTIRKFNATFASKAYITETLLLLDISVTGICMVKWCTLCLPTHNNTNRLLFTHPGNFDKKTEKTKVYFPVQRCCIQGSNKQGK